MCLFFVLPVSVNERRPLAHIVLCVKAFYFKYSADLCYKENLGTKWFSQPFIPTHFQIILFIKFLNKLSAWSIFGTQLTLVE